MNRSSWLLHPRIPPKPHSMNILPSDTALMACLRAALCLFVLALPQHGIADQSGSSTAARPALTVSTATPERLDLPRVLLANGDIQPWQEASVSVQANGLRVLELKAEAGDVVSAGQLLAVLDDALPRAALAQARAALLEAEAAAVDARAHASRGRALRGGGAMSAQLLDQLEAAEQVAAARIEAARANVAARELDVKHARIFAPDAGLIAERNASLGEVVSSGRELFRLIRQRRLEWRARLTEAELGAIRVGDRANIILADGNKLSGSVRRLAPVVDIQRREALAYVDLPVDAALAAGARAGMFARGEFALGSAEVLTVPQQAVVVREAFSYVFVLGADQRVQLTKIDAGSRVDGRVEVRHGIDETSVIVADGAGFLNDGDLVRVAPALPASAAR